MPTRVRAWLARVRRRARRLKRQLWALYFALRDPETPWTARVAIVCAIAYAASPIDLIPDFIPVLGQLDDLIIVPALIGLALRLIPKGAAARARRQAYRRLVAGERVKSPAAIVAALLFGLAWVALALWIVGLFIKLR